MNLSPIRVLTFGIMISSLTNTACAFYASHIGRWVTRDPLGYVTHVGSDALSKPIAGGFIARDLIYYFTRNSLTPAKRMSVNDSMRASVSGGLPDGYVPSDPPGFNNDFNLYEYALDSPMCRIDPSGLDSIGPILPPDRNCFYYEARCNEAHWWDVCAKTYYCALARAVCNGAGEGGWRNCMRECLQCRDGKRRLNDTPILGTIAGCLQAGLESGLGDHAICAVKCIPQTGSQPPSFP